MITFGIRGAIGEPTLEQPVSQACTFDQFESPIYEFWCKRMAEEPRHHRKQWEFVYIAQALAKKGKLSPGSCGLGFGVGQEPLPALFASYGCTVLATDLGADEAAGTGWIETNQHAGQNSLRWEGICERASFERLVRFEEANMNAIPKSYRNFDFTWSACCLEHLGSIRMGLKFIENSLHALKSGGVAVHTTELNCSNTRKTLDNEATVLFRKKDFVHLARRLAFKGHKVELLNFSLGTKALDKHVDVPPYSADNHLKLKIGEFTSTSFGVIVTKK